LSHIFLCLFIKKKIQYRIFLFAYLCYLCGKFETTISPMTIRLYEVTGLVSEILARTKTLRVSRRSGSRSRVCGRRCWFPFDFSGGPPWGGVGFGRHRASRRFRRFPTWFCTLYMRKEILHKYIIVYFPSCVLKVLGMKYYAYSNNAGQQNKTFFLSWVLPSYFW